MTTIELGNIGTEEQAKKIKNVLEGKSFYNFRVEYANMMQNWPVSVSTEYQDTTEEELREMVLFNLALEI